MFGVDVIRNTAATMAAIPLIINNRLNVCHCSMNYKNILEYWRFNAHYCNPSVRCSKAVIVPNPEKGITLLPPRWQTWLLNVDSYQR